MGSNKRWMTGALGAAVLLVAACGEAPTSRSSIGPAGGGATESSKSLPAERFDTAAPAAQSSGAAAPATGGSAPAQAGNNQGQTGSAPSLGQAAALDRKIITTVNLDMQAEDVEAAVARITRIARDYQGFIADSNVRVDGSSKRATITIRIPSSVSDKALDEIKGVAKTIDAENASGNDVTEEYTDLEARKRVLLATEQQLLGFLAQSKSVDETLKVQDRLTQVRTEIDRIQARVNMYDRLTSLATIKMTLRPYVAPKTQPVSGPAWRTALEEGWNASTAVVGGIGLGLLTVAGFSWWLLPFAVLAGWLLRREWRRRRTTPPATPVAPSPAAG